MGHVAITGASSGIGAALAEELARRGHAVGLIARREKELDEVAARARSGGGKAALAVADVLDLATLRKAVASLETEQGPIDCMIASAGASMPTPGNRIDPDRLTNLMRLNYEGVVNAFSTVIPAMVARKSGHIVAISSIAAYRGLPGEGGYSATKAAVSTLMQAFATDLRPYGIRVTTVHPGFVRTPLTAKNRFPMPFLVEVEDAARTIADGVERGRRNVEFPWQLSLAIRLSRILPNALVEAIVASMYKPRGRGGATPPTPR